MNDPVVTDVKQERRADAALGILTLNLFPHNDDFKTSCNSLYQSTCLRSSKRSETSFRLGSKDSSLNHNPKNTQEFLKHLTKPKDSCKESFTETTYFCISSIDVKMGSRAGKTASPTCTFLKSVV